MEKVGVLFCGQGDQKEGMGRSLTEYRGYSKIAAKVNELPGKIKIPEICISGTKEQLRSTAICQPALVFTCGVLYEWLKEVISSREIIAASAGLSLGELPALFAAGGIADFESLMFLAYARGKFMQQACNKQSGIMAAVSKISLCNLREICENEDVEISGNNSPDQYTIAGNTDRVKNACLEIEQMNGKVQLLPVAGAYHSKLMESAEINYKRIILTCGQSFQVIDPNFSLFSSVSGQRETAIWKIKQLLVNQLTSPVCWVDTINSLLESGISKWYSIGPKKTIVRLTNDINPDLEIIPIRNARDIKKLQESF